jgi:hypothetical protein
MRHTLVLVVVLALAACGKSKTGDQAASGSGSTDQNAPSGSGAKDAVLDAWKKGSLDVAAFAVTKSPIGSDCSAGTVNKLEVVVCNFATSDAAKQAETAGLQWVGDTTGSSQAKGTLVIAVADRHKADPNGKTINQIFKLVP